MGQAAVLAIILPLAVYLWAAFGIKGPKTYHDFFNLRQQISSTEFASSSVAYGFQIATISVFLAWGYLHPLPALVNAAAWGVGILVLIPLAKHFIPYIESSHTLHGYIGTLKYRSNTLRTIVGLLTVIGFAGLLLAEIIWGSQVLLVYNSDPIFMYTVTFGLGLFVLAYFLRGGQLSIIHTDQYQLLFAYVGLVATVSWLLFNHVNKDAVSSAAAALVSAVLSILLIVVLIEVRRTAYFSAKKGLGGKFALTILQAVLALGVVVLAVSFVNRIGEASDYTTAIERMQLGIPGVDGWSLLSLSLLPLAWQFIDFTMWQRIGALKLHRTESGEYDLTPLRKGILRYGLESPLTWIFSLSVGVILRFSDLSFDQDSIWAIMESLPSQLAQTGQVGPLFAALFVLAIIAIMLSTIDSSLIGSTTALIYDVLPWTRRMIDSNVQDSKTNNRILTAGKTSAGIIVIIGLGLYYVFTAIEVPILTILFGAYGAQVAFAPAVIGALVLKGRPAAAGWVIASILIGVGGAMWATIVSVGDYTWQLYPPLFALAGSVPVFLVAVLLKKLRG